MTAPSVATRTDQTLKPVAPEPPRMPTRRPPTEAPAIPRRTVTIKRPGSGPGTIRLASNPAMAPTNIQLISPTSSLLLARFFFSYRTGSLIAGDWSGIWSPLGFSKKPCSQLRAGVGLSQTGDDAYPYSGGRGTPGQARRRGLGPGRLRGGGGRRWPGRPRTRPRRTVRSAGGRLDAPRPRRGPGRQEAQGGGRSRPDPDAHGPRPGRRPRRRPGCRGRRLPSQTLRLPRAPREGEGPGPKAARK